uniref:Uncharacterized protein n=1 Tax=Ciona savignyi TaxID=51511 RepID=H2YXK9_CIOSA
GKNSSSLTLGQTDLYKNTFGERNQNASSLICATQHIGIRHPFELENLYNA